MNKIIWGVYSLTSEVLIAGDLGSGFRSGVSWEPSGLDSSSALSASLTSEGLSLFVPGPEQINISITFLQNSHKLAKEVFMDSSCNEINEFTDWNMVNALTLFLSL